MTIELNQQNIYELKLEFNKTIQIMQQNLASNDLKLIAMNETSQYGPSYSELNVIIKRPYF